MKGDVPDLQVLDAPECLVGILKLHILHRYIVHLTEQFRSVDDGILHHHIIAIPDGRTTAHLEVTVGYQRLIHMPQGVFPDKAAAIGLNILTTLDS